MVVELGGAGNQGSPPVLFFDRDIGTAPPLAMVVLSVPGLSLEFHENYFPPDAKDADWMAIVGGWGWYVIGHDSRHHLVSDELDAIRQYRMGCFYLWGSQALRWEKARCLLNAYEGIQDAIANTPRPFIYRILKSGELQAVAIR